MWLMLQQDKPDDYVIATGECHTVREFIQHAFAVVGRRIVWRGSGAAEIGVDASSGQVLIEVDKQYLRPTEVDMLVGDSSKAHQRLGWRHRTSFEELVSEMVKGDLADFGL
jgi:GDPmannose 4,6-dehydratase